MSSIYGGLVVHWGKMHNYLVMELDYRKKVTVNISMIKCLDSLLQSFPENLGATAVTPAYDHLFKVHDYREIQYLT